MYKREEFLQYINEKNHTAEAENVIFNYYKTHHTIENRNLILTMNDGLIRKVSFKFKNFVENDELDDLYQEGVFGLCRAIERYDVDSGFKFSTYAIYWVYQAMNRYLQNSKRIIRMPVHAMESAFRIKSYTGRKYAETGRMPSMEEISEVLNIPIETILLIAQHEKIASLDKELVVENGGEGMCLGDTVQDNHDHYNDINYKIDMQHFMRIVKKTLTDREFYIISLRFGFDTEPETLEEIGLKLGVSRERIRQLEKKALKKLKVKAEKMNLDEYLVFA